MKAERRKYRFTEVSSRETRLMKGRVDSWDRRLWHWQWMGNLQEGLRWRYNVWVLVFWPLAVTCGQGKLNNHILKNVTIYTCFQRVFDMTVSVKLKAHGPQLDRCTIISSPRVHFIQVYYCACSWPGADNTNYRSHNAVLQLPCRTISYQGTFRHQSSQAFVAV